MALLILKLGHKWKQVHSFMPWLLYSWENRPQYPLNRMPDGLQNKSGCFREEQNKLRKLSLCILSIPSNLSLYILYIPRTVFEKTIPYIPFFKKKVHTERVLLAQDFATVDFSAVIPMTRTALFN